MTTEERTALLREVADAAKNAGMDQVVSEDWQGVMCAVLFWPINEMKTRSATIYLDAENVERDGGATMLMLDKMREEMRIARDGKRDQKRYNQMFDAICKPNWFHLTPETVARAFVACFGVKP